MPVSIETFFLNPDAQGTLQARIQQMVAEAILSGRLTQGDKLPSTRKLAAHLGVSRITVTLAYTELQASDYLTARGRSGYYVSENAPEPSAFTTRGLKTGRNAEQIDWARAIGTDFASGATPSKPADWRQYRYPFVYGQPDASLFDHSSWRLSALRALGQKDHVTMTGDLYDEDDSDLTAFIARHILPRRGILAAPSEILLTLGAQNALWLTARLLLDGARTAAFENPGYHALHDILAQTGCQLAPVAVDETGLPPEAVPAQTDVIFTAPSHQCPTSATMPLHRRKALLKRARTLDALIVEDDYEFEISSGTPPSPALKSLDDEGRVIYVGSFSKSLFPGLRLGYLVAAEPFIREARALRTMMLRHPPGLIQRTTAYFLSLGHYDAMIRRVGKAYAQRRAAMLESIDRHGLEIAGLGAHGGSSFWMRAPDEVDTEVLARTLRQQSVLIEPGAPFFAGPERPRQFYRLAYSSIKAAHIDAGLQRIAHAIEAAVD